MKNDMECKNILGIHILCVCVHSMHARTMRLAHFEPLKKMSGGWVGKMQKQNKTEIVHSTLFSWLK